MKKIFSIVLAIALIMAMTVIGYANPNVIGTRVTSAGESQTKEDDNGNVAVPGIQPRMSSSGFFTITFKSNQKLPVTVGSDEFTLSDTSCSIYMDIENLLPKEPLNQDYVTLRLYGKGCGIFGKKVTYDIGVGNLVYEFTGLTKGTKYHFDVEMYDWVYIEGSVTNVDEVYN